MNTGNTRGAEASQVYVSLPAVAGEPSKRLVGFQRVDLMPGASELVTVTVDSSAPNHPLSYFEPDPNGIWSDGNWLTPEGTYTVHVGTSSADTPLQATVNLNVPMLPLSLQLNPETINLSGNPGPITAALSIGAPYNLRDLRITNVRFEGVPALTTTYSSDGRSMTATFDGSRLKHLTPGAKTVSLAADIEKDGIEDTLWVTTTTSVQK